MIGFQLNPATGRLTRFPGLPPMRLQLQRKKGWRLPEGAVSVARPTRWGNPFRVEPGTLCWAVITVVAAADDLISSVCVTTWYERPTKLEAQALAVELYEEHIGPGGRYEIDPTEIVRELGGRDLACYCRVGEPCHGDVLLRIASRGDR